MTITRPVQTSLIDGMDRPIGRVPGSVQTGTNADLIATIAPLYLTGSVLDVTYGEGAWWKRFQPADFTAHDLHKLDGVDFRDLPEADHSIDTVCFDPPYVISGTHSSDRLGPGFQNRYGIGLHNLSGMANTSRGEQDFRAMICAGLLEALRVSRGWVLVKCMEFAQGSHASTDFHDIPFLVTSWALEMGAVKHDQIVHHTGSGPGGHNIYEVKRARRHHSYLIVFKVAS